jgi:hypothetical protein
MVAPFLHRNQLTKDFQRLSKLLVAFDRDGVRLKAGRLLSILYDREIVCGERISVLRENLSALVPV